MKRICLMTFAFCLLKNGLDEKNIFCKTLVNFKR